MPILNISNTHMLYSSADAVNSDTGSTDPTPAGPSYNPAADLFGGLSPRPRTLPESAVLTVPSAMADMSPSDAPGQGIAPLPASALGALGVLPPSAGADTPVAPSDEYPSDPAPYGPGYNPLGGINLGLSPVPRTLPNSAVFTAPSAMADISPFDAPRQGIAPLSAGELGALGVLAPFAGADFPLAPSDEYSSDPQPPEVGPGYDPELQQLINELSGLGQPAPHSEPIQTSRNTSWHHVRIDP